MRKTEYCSVTLHWKGSKYYCLLNQLKARFLYSRKGEELDSEELESRENPATNVLHWPC